MITLAWYFLKVIICSGILCGYYFLALRNKAFHRWNRFYILAAVVISLLIPVMKINFFPKAEEKGTVIQMLQTISYGDEAVVEYSRNNSFQLTTQNITEGFYLLVSLVFFFIFLISLYKIIRLKKKFPAKEFEGISFINTSAKGTPFSFFRSIFWNKAIDLHSKSGQQIFNHEIAHVKEKHSYDKIFMNIVLIFFWINPFFWLMQKELFMIHEFIADKEALEDSDINSFAEMILQTVYPGQNFSLANNFFYSPLKRRLLMLTKNTNPKVSYISRLLVLPLAAIVFFAFTLKVKNKNANLYNGKTITVIIDAGHGGEDNGAHSPNGIKEKDINLAIAKKIADLNSNPHLKIILSRNNDQTISVKDRVDFAKRNNADMFISIHVNGSVNEQLNGFSVLIGGNNEEGNQLLGSELIKELKESYKTEDKIAIRNKGLLALNLNTCPAAIVECGYITNPNDVAFISKDGNQEKVAKNILDAINVYASSKENGDSKSEAFTDNLSVFNDSVPSMHYNGKEIKNISVQSKSKNIKVTEPVIKVTYQDGNTEMISKEESDKRGFVLPPPPPPIRIYNGKKVRSVEGISNQKVLIHFIDGTQETITREEAKKAGFILFIPPKIVKDSIPGKVFTKVQVEASFPGGLQAWSRYISRAIADSISKFTEADYGTCVIRFIVNVDGRVSDVIATTMKGTELAKVSVNAIRKGPKWIPASQNGKPVAAYRLQPVTLQSPNDNKKTAKGNVSIVHTDAKTIHGTSSNSQEDSVPDKVYTKVQIEASFPGGQQAWIKYISKAISNSISKFTEADYGTCVIRFIVNVNGSISDVVATTMKGTELAKVSVNAIRKGPKWIPASQNGKTVAAYRLQPVTLSNPQDKPPVKFDSNKTSTTINTADDNQKVIVKLEKTASLPGGQSAWLKYISRTIQKNGNKLIADKNSNGICDVRFIVSKDGQVSDVKAVTKQGSQLADVAVNAIKKGPRWIPGMQNGHEVNSYVVQPVRFILNDTNSRLIITEPE